jgi:thioredoxin-like negative regulator of GroEL
LAAILILSGVSLGGFWLLKSAHIRKLNRAPALSPEVQASHRETAGGLVLVYFGSDTCAACPAQERYIAQLPEHWHANLDVQYINVEERPEVARRYSVLTVPTTILVDRSGTVREVNYGLTSSMQLNRQLATLLDGQVVA